MSDEALSDIAPNPGSFKEFHDRMPDVDWEAAALAYNSVLAVYRKSLALGSSSEPEPLLRVAAAPIDPAKT